MKIKNISLIILFFGSTIAGTLTGCGSNKSISNTDLKESKFLPFDIDVAGTIKRFYANDSNSINIKIPATYSLDSNGKVIEGNAYQIKTIGEFCFANNDLIKSVSIPSTIETISESAFYNCSNLETINIPSSIGVLDNNALEKCPKLTELNIEGNNGIILSQNNNLTEFSIPSSIAKIGDYVFSSWNNLRNLTIHESIVSIGDAAITNCEKLSNVSIYSILNSIGDDVFNGCPLLTDLGITKESKIFFSKSQNVTKFSIPESVNSIGAETFYNWEKLNELYIPSNIKYLSNIFRNNFSLRKLTCPNVNVLSLFYSKSEGYPIEENDNLYYITHKPYSTSYSYNYYIPKTLKEIHILENSSKTLENYCFYNMSSLSSVYLPYNLTSFGTGAFAGCTGLNDVHFFATCDWTYSMDYYATDYGTILQSTMNSPTALASALKAHNGYYYNWKSNSI